MKKFKFDVIDLDCANCAQKLEDEINKNENISNCIVNFGTSKITLESNLENPLNTIKEIAAKVEPDCRIQTENTINKEESKGIFEIVRLVIGIILAIIGFLKLPSFVIANNVIYNNISTMFVLAAYLTLMYRTIKKAIKQIKGKVIDENTLIIISCIGAYLVGKHEEGFMVILLFEIGKILEGSAISKSRSSIKNLMNIKPEYANIKLDNGNQKKVEPDEVHIGDIIVVKQGEKIPLDGIVLSGIANINNSALTGESKLISAKENDKVLSGSINESGIIEVRVTEEYQNSTANRILNLVEKATDRKAKTENFVSKAAKIYTPIVIGVALIVAVFLPLLSKNITYSQSIYRALIFLVIACPCSIAISVPLAYFSGIGKASKEGILVKGSDYLDGLKDINHIIFDKTGTITTGKFSVQKIVSLDEKISNDELFAYYAKGEALSNHPIAKTIIEKFRKNPDTNDVKNFKEATGKGIEYTLNDKHIKIGNKEFVNNSAKINEIGTIIYLSINEELKGYIVLADSIKENIKNEIKRLKQLNIKTSMYTGDNLEISKSVAKLVEIEDVRAGMLPEDKFNELEKAINNNKKGKKVAFVGDGINDSPVIARADIGISMGAIGAASSIEASDVVIMTDEIHKILDGIQISKKTAKIIKQNLIFAISVKIIVFIMSYLGLADMWQAVFADVGTTIITIFNTLRILKQ